MPVPCPPSSFLLPDDRVILVSDPDNGLIISSDDPQEITSVSSLPWVDYDPARPGSSWTSVSAVSHSRFMRVGKYVQFEIIYVFNASPVFDTGVFLFDPPPGTALFEHSTGFGANCYEPAYWAAFDVSTSQVFEGQTCFSDDGSGIFCRIGDDLIASNSGLSSTTFTWDAGDKLMATGVVEII